MPTTSLFFVLFFRICDDNFQCQYSGQVLLSFETYSGNQQKIIGSNCENSE